MSKQRQHRKQVTIKELVSLETTMRSREYITSERARNKRNIIVRNFEAITYKSTAEIKVSYQRVAMKTYGMPYMITCMYTDGHFMSDEQETITAALQSALYFATAARCPLQVSYWQSKLNACKERVS